MSSTLFAALTLASLGAAHADGLRPIEANTNDLGEVSGVTGWMAGGYTKVGSGPRR